MGTNRKKLYVVAFLLFSAALTTFLVLQRVIFTSQAGGTDEPVFVTVSDEQPDGFSVSWVTTKITQGAVIIDKIIYAEEEAGFVHQVKAVGLKKNTTYKFAIKSGEAEYNNSNNFYTAKTSNTTLLPKKDALFGRVIGSDSVNPVTTGYVAIQIDQDGAKSNILTSLLNEQGGWQIDKSLFLSSEMSGSYSFKDTSVIIITVFLPGAEEKIIRRYELNVANTLQIPDIFIGEDVPWELPAIEE